MVEMRPVFLILDWYYCHILNVEIIDEARNNLVEIKIALPDSAYKLQSLDRSYMGVLKIRHSGTNEAILASFRKMC